jgi:mRNA interferase MazF
MRRGDVVYADIPEPKGPAGHEQILPHYAIIVQSDAVPDSLSTVMLVPTTSKLNALRFPYTFRVEPSTTNGFNLPSVLLVSQLRAIDRRRIQDAAGHYKILGHLESEHLQELRDQLRKLLAL